jgi:hypothetical protein
MNTIEGWQGRSPRQLGISKLLPSMAFLVRGLKHLSGPPAVGASAITGAAHENRRCEPGSIYHVSQDFAESHLKCHIIKASNSMQILSDTRLCHIFSHQLDKWSLPARQTPGSLYWPAAGRHIDDNALSINHLNRANSIDGCSALTEIRFSARALRSSRQLAAYVTGCTFGLGTRRYEPQSR